MSRDWVSPTLEEQINNAGIILTATVKSVPQNFGGNTSVDLENVQYIRGCNKQEITVDNFKGGNMCGAGVPNIGDKIIVFGCGDRDVSRNIRLHNFLVIQGLLDGVKKMKIWL